jgi:nitrogen fixation/metabolism regulation signal transduction histidine kinase
MSVSRHNATAGSPATTEFAPAGRADQRELLVQQATVDDAPLLRALMDAMSQMVLVLNDKRQVVAANRCAAAAAPPNGAALLGKRPGELFRCIYSQGAPDGCGTGRHCSTCGAVEAILESGRGCGQVTRECRLNLDTPQGSTAVDLRVTATPVHVNGESYTICAIDDVSDRKRLAVLTRMFFHDVLNTAGAIRGLLELLLEDLPESRGAREEFREVAELTRQLVDEIESQRDLMYAEAGDLVPRLLPLDLTELLASLRSLYAAHPVAAERTLVLGRTWDGPLVTDGQLLARVIGNMIKNALEATEPGDEVRIESVQIGSDVEIRVRNPAVMPERVQLQVFQRSFSTKADAGRGIGTHSMKLLGERYLGGQVGFVSCAPDGTTFFIRLPKDGHRPA